MSVRSTEATGLKSSHMIAARPTGPVSAAVRRSRSGFLKMLSAGEFPVVIKG